VRSALLSVKGVTSARVSLQSHEAVVTYNPTQCTVDDMIKAVGNAEGVEAPGQYSASVKKPTKKSSGRAG
jgi:copper chaperone CopZ